MASSSAPRRKYADERAPPVISDWVRSNVNSVTKNMLEDRGFSEIQWSALENDQERIFGEGGRLSTGVKAGSRECHVLIIPEKMGIKSIRELEKEYLGGTVASVIIVTMHRPTPPAHKRVLEPSVAKWCSVFGVHEVIRNVARHHLVPHHIKIDAVDMPKLFHRWRENDTAHLPVMLSTDPQARYLGLVEGDVVKIEGPDGSHMGTQTMYRVIKT